ncbi:MAG: PIN domain nuclease, partial [Chloroflexi bacterium]|nr:PIN domain nuclease [Chloroflexota bacterium]
MRIDFIIRLLGMAAAAVGGWRLGSAIASQSGADELRWIIILALAGALLGLILTPYVTTVPARWLWRHVKIMPVSDLLVGAAGLILALIAAALLAIPLSMLPYYFGQVLPFVAAIVFAYFGVSVMIMRKKEILDFLASRRSASTPQAPGKQSTERAIIVDTSAIIDGRIADISQTGFVD